MIAARDIPVSACSYTQILPAEVRPDLTGEKLKINLPGAGPMPKQPRRRTCEEAFLGYCNPKKPQFTNLRMRTFIATPSARKVNSTEDPP
jgi:hypothetical protein